MNTSRWILVVSSVALAAGVGVPSAMAEKMYLAARGGIVRTDLDGSDIELLVAGVSGPKGIALDVQAGQMYWTDTGAKKIQRANLRIPPAETPDNRTDIEDLVTGGYSYGIALDIASGQMYWTHTAPSGTRKIQRANMDGSGVEDLVTTGGSTLFGIALDVAGAKVYWADLGTGKIQRAGLDGSNVEDVVTELSPSPVSIALDLKAGKIYFTLADTLFWQEPGYIRRANLDGSGIENLITTPAFTNPRGIALDIRAEKLYWTDHQASKIQRANLDGSGVETLFDGAGGVEGIALDLTPPIPTLSKWDVIAMTLSLVVLGSLVIMRHARTCEGMERARISRIVPRLRVFAQANP